ncbi:hypothetical protein DRW48_06310 [Paracoccus suum]|uniref:Rhamnosyl transferase n=2 Tax=Paracoccus suum TaxID=2259340 RepID=A0A344PP10_9RHOB|nr:hypothetical protein DRW48_06310 [Paracoccus suum]
MRVQMLGLCRFSYLGLRGFQVEHDDMEERRAFLYDEGRLVRRWHWFEKITLPALRAQTDPDFTLVVMTGPDLPDPWLSLLQQLCEEMPQLELALVPPMRFHLQACKHALLPHKDMSADVIGHFRMDDDDAVAIDYVARAREDFGLVEPAWHKRKAASIDYMRGLVLKATESGVSVEPRMIYNAVAGLTVYLPPGDERSATQLPHWRLGHHMPGLILPDEIMFCRFLNHDNDSGAIGPGYDFDGPPPDAARVLAERFKIDLADINRDARDFGLPQAGRKHWGAT